MRPLRRPARGRIMTAGLLSGGAAGLLLMAPTFADAASPLAEVFGQTTPPTTEPTEDAAGTDDSTTADASADTTADDAGTTDEAEADGRGEHLLEALQPLVDDGTLTQEQADAVIDALQSAMPRDVWIGGPMHGGFPGMPGMPGFPGMDFPGGHGFPGDVEISAEGPGISVHVGIPIGPFAAEVVAEAIGIDVSDLLTQLTDGSSVAEIAAANGVEVQAVIDALVQHVSDRLAEAVDAGRITQAEADERLGNMTERITNWINGTDDATEDATATEDTTATEETTDTTMT